MITFAPVEPRYDSAQLTLPNGVRVNYVHGGAVDGPAVIMLHGFSDSSFSFSRVLPLMPAHLRVIALDQRGHGNSDRPREDYSVNAFATDVLDLMDRLRIEHATLVGHSMGSFVARRVAEKAPDRISRLVLIGTALNVRNPGVADLRAAIDALTDPVDEAFIREFQRSTIARPVPHAFFERVVAESKKLPASVWKQVAAGLWDYQPQWPITCPTSILGGDCDAVFSPDEQAAVFTATQRSTFHLEPGVGHALHWEAPERFVALAFSSVEQIEAAERA
jgi:pimeloyl-ACP methyl ester carboxylesterase